ncbi:LacI family transcriptional regulator [Alteromonas sediminis]|uniref:LacI family transcriptional regulator n=1 Tax=Alteromonas sediminis TaxID=2259342 RepID=A0A3N5ZAX9_9ALTE|nr:substrate-binding domain-containing protein [Alteromonas sediminis]RPJ68354.1 LacI family transcriptional regulator [Alteromonas sediminis]
MQNNSRFTLSDLAKLAGVSTSTASRALRGNPIIKQQTRERIQALALEHNFSLNAAASRLRTQRTHVIAVILNLTEHTEQSINDPFLLKVVGDLNQALNERNYELLLSNSFMAKDDWTQYFIKSSRADGLIVVGQAKSDTKMIAAAEAGAPIVVWGDPHASAKYTVVGSENRLGAKQATEHLIKLGHTRPVFLGDLEHAEMGERYKGYCDALAAHNIPLDDSLVMSTDLTYQAGYDCINQSVKTNGLNFDGIFACSDMVALGAMKALKERYVNIPVDVAIIGFDDIPMAEMSHPALSSIKQNTKLAAEIMVTELLRQLNGEPGQSHAVGIELKIRHSSDPTRT